RARLSRLPGSVQRVPAPPEVRALGRVLAEGAGSVVGDARLVRPAEPGQQLGADGGETVTAEDDVRQRVQTVARTVHLADRDGPVEPDDGAVRQLDELVVAGQD